MSKKCNPFKGYTRKFQQTFDIIKHKMQFL
jgi:hypothetical protein